MQLNNYMAAYSRIPFGLSASQLSNEYEYIFDILFEGQTINTMSLSTFNGLVQTRITFSQAHTFKAGQSVFIDDLNNIGRYNILFVDSTTSIIIDYQEPKPLTGTPKVYRNAPYNMPPNLEGKMLVDLSPVLRTFVTENISDLDLVYTGDRTRFCYDVKVSERKIYEFDFTDNFFISGSNIGFIAEGTSIGDKPLFEPGDLINIQQEQYEWNTVYIDFFIDPLGPVTVQKRLVLEDPTPINYGSGFQTPFIAANQQLLINGTPYDGFTTINKISSRKVVTNTPTEGLGATGSAKVFGHMVPEYNGVATVVGLTYSASAPIGWVVITDKPYQRDTPAIGGKIVRSNGERLTTWGIDTITDKCVFNARLDHPDWQDDFSDWVLQGCSTIKKISTILNTGQVAINKMTPIDYSAKSYLLIHNEANNSTNGIKVTGFDKGGNIIGENLLINNSGNNLDYYVPVGLNDIINSSDLEAITGSISLTQSNTPDYYKVCAINKLNDLNATAMASVGDLTIRVSDAQAATWFSQNQLQIGQEVTVVVGVFVLTGEILTINSDGFGNQIIEIDAFFPLGSEQPATVRGFACEASECIYYRIEKCTPYKDYNIMFKDAFGSFVSYPFKLVSRDYTEVERNNFYKQESLDTYNDYDRGEKSYAIRSRDKIKLTTDWVNDFHNYIIKDLFKSASVFIQDETGRLFGVTIEETDVEVKSDQNDMLHNYEFTFKKSRQNWRF